MKEGSKFSLGASLKSSYELKSGYDPISPFDEASYLISDYETGFLPFSDLNFISEVFSLKNHFEFYQDFISSPGFQSLSKDLGINSRDIEHNSVKFSYYLLKTHIKLKILQNLFFLSDFQVKIKEYRLFPNNPKLAHEENSFDQISSYQAKPKIQIKTSLGDFSVGLKLSTKKEKMDKIISSSFSLKKSPFVSYFAQYHSQEFWRKRINFSFGFFHERAFFNQPFLEKEEFSGVFSFDFLMSDFLKTFNSFKVSFRSYLFDNEVSLFFRSGFLLLSGESHRFFLEYNFLHSDFSKNSEFSSNNHRISLSYSFVIPYYF